MKDSERRRYFRINDSIGLTVKTLNEKELSASNSAFSMNPLRLIHDGDEELEKLILALESSSPELARLASLLNQKIERVANLLAMESDLLDHIDERVQQVNISACGLAFNYHQALLNNTMLELSMHLFPEQKKIHSRANVVHCEKAENGLWWVRVDFVAMDKDDQELLIQHIVRNQGAMLRERALQKR
ncbi:PilZ domain-containing protein [Agaribacterium haliotis]|uniref:PilZ domain-containing protein n=1 Tax=Agaribacterium haliotis TaxID=2013869 RepID=UPI000BB53969|nr:PilZ domain-containing protein [Agaribacterium haliotis]